MRPTLVFPPLVLRCSSGRCLLKSPRVIHSIAESPEPTDLELVWSRVRDILRRQRQRHPQYEQTQCDFCSSLHALSSSAMLR